MIPQQQHLKYMSPSTATGAGLGAALNQSRPGPVGRDDGGLVKRFLAAHLSVDQVSRDASMRPQTQQCGPRARRTEYQNTQRLVFDSASLQ